jgi:hypothetical protein
LEKELIGILNMEIGGQDSLVDGSYDRECRDRFGAREDVGSWRAQVLDLVDL